MNILITGGAGFIGSHLRNRLLNDGHRVRILDNLLPQVHGENPNVDFSEVEFIKADVRDHEAVQAALKDIEIVYHLAAETGVGQSQYEIERYISVNTYGTAVVLDAAVKANVNQVLITSSRAVYGEGVHVCNDCGNSFVPKSRAIENLAKGDWEVFCPNCGSVATAMLMKEDDPSSPVSIYGLTKLQQEQTAAQISAVHPLSVTNLRLFNVFGPGQSLSNPYVGVLGTFFRRINAGNEIDIYEDGRMRRDFVYVGDVVEALVHATGNQAVFNRSVNVGTGEAVTLEQAGDEMFRQLGKERRVKFSKKFRLGDIHHAVAETSLCEELLRFRPSVSFSEGLASFIAWAKTAGVDATDIDSLAESQLRQNSLLGQAN